MTETEPTGPAAAADGPESAEEPALSYEQARDELVEVVRRLEAGGATLEESLALWERGEQLAGVCREFLAGARARLDAALAEPEPDTAEGAAEPEGAARAGREQGDA